jgi:hypothetical protein
MNTNKFNALGIHKFGRAFQKSYSSFAGWIGLITNKINI